MKRFLLLAAACLVACAAHADRARFSRLQTPDDIGLAVAYYPASGATSAAPAVVLLHSFGQSRDEWGSFPLLLQQNGIAVLNLDFRGHGESTRRITASGPQLVDHQNFTERDFQNLLLDINTAVNWLEEQPGIDKRRLLLIGSSLGANLAVRYAMEHDDLAGLILFSPGLAYKDIRIDDAFPKMRRLPLRVVVSLRDTFAFESSRRLLEARRLEGRARDFKEMITCSGEQHGAEQLRVVKELPLVLIRWLRQILYNERVEEPAPLPPPPPTNAPPVKTAPPRRPNRPLP
jgi:pimeloyl-ACP methyl ester carboxylesterase